MISYGEDFYMKQWFKDTQFFRQLAKEDAVKNKIYEGNSQLNLIQAVSGTPVFFNLLIQNESDQMQ